MKIVFTHIPGMKINSFLITNYICESLYTCGYSPPTYSDYGQTRISIQSPGVYGTVIPYLYTRNQSQSNGIRTKHYVCVIMPKFAL